MMKKHLCSEKKIKLFWQQLEKFAVVVFRCINGDAAPVFRATTMRSTRSYD